MTTPDTTTPEPPHLKKRKGGAKSHGEADTPDAGERGWGDRKILAAKDSLGPWLKRNRITIILALITAGVISSCVVPWDKFSCSSGGYNLPPPPSFSNE